MSRPMTRVAASCSPRVPRHCSSVESHVKAGPAPRVNLVFFFFFHFWKFTSFQNFHCFTFSPFLSLLFLVSSPPSTFSQFWNKNTGGDDSRNPETRIAIKWIPWNVPSCFRSEHNKREFFKYPLQISLRRTQNIILQIFSTFENLHFFGLQPISDRYTTRGFFFKVDIFKEFSWSVTTPWVSTTLDCLIVDYPKGWDWNTFENVYALVSLGHQLMGLGWEKHAKRVSYILCRVTMTVQPR